MAERTERRFTRDLILEAVPYTRILDAIHVRFRVGDKTDEFFSQHLCCSGHLVLRS